MNCTGCGQWNDDTNKFCVKCGKSLSVNTAEAMPAVKGNKKRGMYIGIGVAAVLGISAVTGYIGFQKNQEEKRIEEENQKWETYATEVNDWLVQLTDQSNGIIMEDTDKNQYETLVQNIKKDLEGKKSEDEINTNKEALQELVDHMTQKSADKINSYMQDLEGRELAYATEIDVSAIDEYQQQVANFIGEKNYVEALDILNEWENYIIPLATVYDNYNVSVKQYDISEYPKIKVYLDVEDETGNFVDNLTSEAFFVNEGRNISEPLTRTTVSNVTKLNENEGISLCLAADISGSMYYDMDATKQAMSNFVRSVQFDKGDEIELTVFSEYAYICNSFTNNQSDILSSISNIQANGSTRLYDTLISEIERVHSRSNAKCVIGFTDGIDNVSVNTAQDVINKALAVNVPVFIIGIGTDCDDSTLNNIAVSTGGRYENISSVDSMEAIYNSIYTQEKEVYLLEYTVSDENNFENDSYADIYIRTNDGNGGFVEKYDFKINDYFKLMYNKFLIAGIDCQTKGERNLLDSGLIITTPDAYATPECLAYQCQASIDGGGVGSTNSSTYEVLVDFDIVNIQKTAEGYTVYGMSNYDIRKQKKYSAVKNAMEKEMIELNYGIPAGDELFWIEENITNYEKLTLIKDTDGKWKFNTRTYERVDGNKAVTINKVYSVTNYEGIYCSAMREFLAWYC